jgi:hypothetical protein
MRDEACDMRGFATSRIPLTSCLPREWPFSRRWRIHVGRPIVHRDRYHRIFVRTVMLCPVRLPYSDAES